jgi:hypothetical protein
MNASTFIYWLEGFIEGRDILSQSELEIVREKLSKILEIGTSSYTIDNIKFTQTTTNDKLE